MWVQNNGKSRKPWGATDSRPVHKNLHSWRPHGVREQKQLLVEGEGNCLNLAHTFCVASRVLFRQDALQQRKEERDEKELERQRQEEDKQNRLEALRNQVHHYLLLTSSTAHYFHRHWIWPVFFWDEALLPPRGENIERRHPLLNNVLSVYPRLPSWYRRIQRDWWQRRRLGGVDVWMRRSLSSKDLSSVLTHTQTHRWSVCPYSNCASCFSDYKG